MCKASGMRQEVDSRDEVMHSEMSCVALTLRHRQNKLLRLYFNKKYSICILHYVFQLHVFEMLYSMEDNRLLTSYYNTA